ncbi:MAG: hypothetical protein JKY45_07520 [Emcibacter sp.]|nr:hypothetical protein [Emcibacter sp.]
MAKSKSSKRWTNEKEGIFLEVLQQTGNVTKATVQAGLDRSLVYRRRNMQPEFREKWQNAMGQALDYLEAYLWDKAMGKEVSDVDQGGRVVDEKIAIFLLKAHRPEIFGDGKKRQDMEGQNKGESPRIRLMKKLDQMAKKSIDGG